MIPTLTASGMVRILVAVVVCLLLPAGALARQQPATSTAAKPAELLVVASIPPVQGIVRPLLEDSAVPHRLETLIPPGVSEHGYEISPAKLATLRRADVVVIVGLGLEPQVEKFLKQHKNPKRRVVVLADVVGITMDHDHADHSGHAHGPDGECLHVVDPHIWLDPVLVEKMVSAVAQTLRDVVADKAVATPSNTSGAPGLSADTAARIWLAEEATLKRVQSVHSAYEAGLKNARTRTLVVGHDAWGYLAKRYDLRTVAIKGLLATEPTPKSLTEAQRAVREHALTTVFVEPQLSQRAGASIASATGATLRMLDPLGRGDWFQMMESNLAELKAALVGVESVPAPVPAGTQAEGKSPSATSAR